MNQTWLRLTDYASKYRISISTLRRRIKNGQLTYRFEDGKYLIPDDAPTFVEAHGASEIQLGGDLTPVMSAAMAAAEAAPLVSEAQEKLNQLRASGNITTTGAETNSSMTTEEPILSSANRLLSELKRAYMSILQGKEEQIIQLKEEVTDLKTLVRVLESDNDRMRRAQGQSPLL